MTENVASPRRRFQFRLRTLMIVVTLLAVAFVYIRWQAEIIRERGAEAQKYRALTARWLPRDVGYSSERRKAPWPLRLMGEEGVVEIDVPLSTTNEEINRLKRLFPEANVGRGRKERYGW